MRNLEKLTLENIIRLTKSSEIKFKKGNFKGAIEEKREVKSILNSDILDKEIIDKFKYELSNIYYSKFDLIFDHKSRITELKRSEIIKKLDQKSDERYKKGDYKGAIRAARRSEKYLSK